MTDITLTQDSEACLRSVLLAPLPNDTWVSLYGSRARGDASWTSDFDLWIGSPVERSWLHEIEEVIDACFVPFNVDLVTNALLNGRFGENVKQETKPWL